MRQNFHRSCSQASIYAHYFFCKSFSSVYFLHSHLLFKAQCKSKLCKFITLLLKSLQNINDDNSDKEENLIFFFFYFVKLTGRNLLFYQSLPKILRICIRYSSIVFSLYDEWVDLSTLTSLFCFYFSVFVEENQVAGE